MAPETLIKCAHPPCQCLVEAEPKVCSSSCASARGATRGHAGCVAEHNVGEDDEFEPLLPAE